MIRLHLNFYDWFFFDWKAKKFSSFYFAVSNGKQHNQVAYNCVCEERKVVKKNWTFENENFPKNKTSFKAETNKHFAWLDMYVWHF